ncbi:MAG: LptF/LptG family permease, partial [Prevotellaceae bacterium]|nr:LptF/LptG family permease [Prevotellaceae bacterium]
MKKIDLYIIGKFIGTYLLMLAIIIVIIIIFDISEHIDDFVTKNAPLSKIVFNFYLTVIPFYINTFSSLFVFITVIFFTSKMAYNTEIIAILSSGVSFMRMMYPYFISASMIFLFSAALNHFIIPPANKIRIEFETQYIRNPYLRKSMNLHLQVQPNIYLYISNFYPSSNRASNFCLERFENNVLKSKLIADYAIYDMEKKVWQMNNYFIRDLSDSSEIITTGTKMDTAVNFSAEELKQRDNVIISMNYFELQDNIKEQKMRGQNPSKSLLENYNRTSIPFSVFVLTLIGVSLSSRKIRGGIGMQIGIGIALSFIYILLLRFSEVFIQVGVASPMLAAWIPN